MFRANMSSVLLPILTVLMTGSQVYGKSMAIDDPNAGSEEVDIQVDNTVLPRSLADLNSGLPDSIADQVKLKRGKNYFFLLTKTPTYAFDFRTAEHLRKSLIPMDHTGMDIGHAMLAWSCVNPATGRRVEGSTGQTGESLSQSFAMLKSGWGMTTFLSTFVDGYLNTPEEVDEDIVEAAEANHLRFVGVEISDQQCGSLQAFLQRYAEGPELAQTNFGFMRNVYKYEGAGCGSFAAVGLEKSQVFSNSLPYLWRTLEVPKQLVGKGSYIPSSTEIYPRYSSGKSVGAGRLLNSLWRNYPSSERGIPMKLADPEMFIHLIQGLEMSVAKRLGGKQPAVSAKSMQLEAKARAVRAVKQPFESGRLGEIEIIPIDSKFDRQTRALEGSTDTWVAEFLKAGGKVRPIQMYLKPGLLFEKN